jgi:hypothetical protein
MQTLANSTVAGIPQWPVLPRSPLRPKKICLFPVLQPKKLGTVGRIFKKYFLLKYTREFYQNNQNAQLKRHVKKSALRTYTSTIRIVTYHASI